MRTFKLPILGFIATLTPLSFAVPARILSVEPRSQFCSNAATTIAGTTLDRRTYAADALNLRSSSNNVLWCVPHSQTYVTLTVTTILDQYNLLLLLSTALTTINQYTINLDVDVIPGGTFTAQDGGLILQIWNANNHQITWNVLSGAVWAITDYMMNRSAYGMMVFDIYDGHNQVGQGTIS